MFKGERLEEPIEMQPVNPIFWKEKTIAIMLLIIAVFFALQQSGLGFLDYIPLNVIRILQILMIITSVLLALWFFLNSRKLPTLFNRGLWGLLLLNVIYGIFGIIYDSGINLIFHIESIVFVYISMIIISDPRIYVYVIKIFFFSGVILVFLNMIPILYYARVIDMDFVTIPRLIETEEYHPDSISFGIFGRAESSEAPGKFFARLHGWSLEPIHWGYFVVLFIASGLILYTRSKTFNSKIIILLFLSLLFVHLYFVQSVVIFFVLGMWFLLMSIIFFTRKIFWLKKIETLIIFSFFMLYGLLVPFAMTFIPGIELLLLEDTITNKGTNWSAKIGFLSLGSSLFTRFFPSNIEVSSSQNFILSLYIKYGYFLILPFLIFLYWIIKKFISGYSFTIMSAGILILLAHMVAVPPLFFHPSGVLFVVLIMGATGIFKIQKS